MQMTIRPNVMTKRLKLAQELADQNGGKLPNPWKMIQQGHGGLYRYIQRHPEKFDHFDVEEAVEKERIKQHKQGNFNVAIREEHVKSAQNLVRQHGELPDNGWLSQNGYTRLASYVRTYPYVFDNIVPNAKGLTYKKERRV